MRILIEEYRYDAAGVKDVLHGIDALENVEGRVSIHYVGYYYNTLLKDCVAANWYSASTVPKTLPILTTAIPLNRQNATSYTSLPYGYTVRLLSSRTEWAAAPTSSTIRESYR